MMYLWIFVLSTSCIVQVLAQRMMDKNTKNTETLADAHSRLLKTLLTNYDKRILPQYNDTSPVTLSIGINLINLVELFEHEEVLETSVYMQQMWSDYRLSWDPSKYKRVHVIHIPVDDLWRPDIALYNNADTRVEAMNTLAMVFSNGRVLYSPRARLRTLCSIDMMRFPFDEQVCLIQLGSFTYDGSRLELSRFPHNNSFDRYQTNNEWTITSTSATVVSKQYDCCPEPYQHLKYDIRLKRNAVYYTHVFVLPAVIIAFLVPFQFLIPPDSKERLTVGSSLLLGIIILITMIQDFLPEAHPTLPYIVQYYCVTMVWIAISLISSIWIINIHRRGPRKHKVPDIIRQIFLKTLQTLVCLKEDNYHPLDESEAISYRELEKQLAVNETPKIEGDKLERDVNEILRQVNSLLLRGALAERRAHARSEWYQVARVFDRIMFFLFGLTFIIYSCVLLT